MVDVCISWIVLPTIASLLFSPLVAGNLLILYLKHNYFDIAADLLAESTHLTYTYLTPELYEFIDAQIMVQTSPEEVLSCCEFHFGRYRR